MSRPGHDEISEVHVGPGLEALQPALFDQVIAELAEAKSGLVVAEARSGEHAEPYIGEARTVAVAALEAEIDRPADDQGKQVRIRKQCRRHELGQNIQSREGCRVAHQGQLDRAPRSCGSRAATRSARIRAALPLPSDAATSRCPDAGGSRDRPRRRGRSDRGSCTDPRASTRPSARSTVFAARLDSAARRCSASASAPVRNSHSARCSSSAKVSSCRRSQRVLRQQRRTGGEIGERRGVGGRGLGALARDQVELGQLLALVS